MPALSQVHVGQLCAGCSRIVIVPVIRGFDKANGRDNVEVVGFAAFFLEGTLREGGKGNSGSSSVIGRFLRIVVPGELGEAGDYGLRGLQTGSDDLRWGI